MPRPYEKKRGNRITTSGIDVLIRHKRSRRDILSSTASTFVMWRPHLDVPKVGLILDSSMWLCCKADQPILPTTHSCAQTSLQRNLVGSS
jgi:hypothetical protein